MKKIRYYLDTTPASDSVDTEGQAKGAALVEKVLKHFRTKEASEHYFSKYSGEYIDGINYRKDEQGLYVETDNFLNGVPPRFTEAELPISMVTVYDTAATGMPQFGIYELEGVSAIVDPYNERRQAGRGGFDNDQIWADVPGWRIRVQGKNLESVVDLYRKFRSGQIKPTEAWDDMAFVVKELQTEVQRLHDVLLSASQEQSEAATASN